MSDKAITKEYILEQIRKIALESGGKPPGLAKFSKMTGIKTSKLQGTLWPRWSDALLEAGYTPNTLNSGYSEAYLLECIAELTREIGRLPKKLDLKHASFSKKSFPSPDTFYRQLGLTDELFNKLAVWVHDKKEWSDVATLLHSRQQLVPKTSNGKKVKCADLTPSILSDGFIPPVVQCIPALAKAEPAIVEECRKQHLDENVAFENRVATAFRILGFSVEQLGQGAGRVADGIAKCSEGHWAIVYDAKVRSNGYKMQTEDRKFKEYIERHSPDLKKQGITKVYFSIISSAFSSSDLPKAMELKRSTGSECIFLEADALVRLIEMKIKHPITFQWKDVESYFIQTRILKEGDIKHNA